MRELLINLLRHGSRFVYLIDGEYHRYTSSLSVVYSLHGLRHDGVIGGDDNDREVGELRAPGSHGGESLMTRSVEEGDPPPVGKFDVVGTDVLGDTSGLSSNNVGFADIVKQRGLSMVNVSHDSDHRRP